MYLVTLMPTAAAYSTHSERVA